MQQTDHVPIMQASDHVPIMLHTFCVTKPMYSYLSWWQKKVEEESIGPHNVTQKSENIERPQPQ